MVPHQANTQGASEEKAAPTCRHHWIIETANGPISRGVCRKCSESREFKNSFFEVEQELRDRPSRVGLGVTESVEDQKD